MLTKITLGVILMCGTATLVNAAPASCYLEHQGNVYINDTCEFTATGDGGFNLRSLDGWAVNFVIVDEGWGGAFWNADGQGLYGDRLIPAARLHSNLGYLKRDEQDGACWSNHESKLCAW